MIHCPGSMMTDGATSSTSVFHPLRPLEGEVAPRERIGHDHVDLDHRIGIAVAVGVGLDLPQAIAGIDRPQLASRRWRMSTALKRKAIV